MSFLQRLFYRLGFIAILAVSIRIVGGAFSPVHQLQQSPPVSPVPAASLDDPVMKIALGELRRGNGGVTGSGRGAKLSFHTSAGEVTLTPGEIDALNIEYWRLKPAIGVPNPPRPTSSSLQDWYRASAPER